MDRLARPVGTSEALRKITESMAGPVEISDEIRKSMDSVRALDRLARPVGTSEALRRITETMAGPVEISDAIRRSIESAKALEPFAQPLNISDELRHSLEHTALLAGNIDQCLSSMHIAVPAADSWYRDDFELAPFPRLPEPTPNPIWQTNDHLAELTGTVTQLIDVARQQAELSQAIRNSTELALKYAIQSGEDAKAATLLARKSVRLTALAITIAIIAAVAGIVANYHLSNSTEARLKEEIRLLRNISRQLQQLNDRPATDSAIATKPKLEPEKGSQPASAR